MSVLPPSCPSCGKLFNARMLIDSAGPVSESARDGDINLCAYCGFAMVFENNRPRTPTVDELAQIIRDPRVVRAQRIILETRSKWRP